MLLPYLGKLPLVDPSAWIAPNAMVCGDVTIGPGARVMYGAQIVAEGGRIEIGAECVVMENAVQRSNAHHSLQIGNNCLIGPQTHVVGCRVDDEVFIATGASVFHGAHIGRGSEVRIHAVVHIKTHLPDNSMVPIGWVAVGSPATILPPHEHDAIWARQQPLNFSLTVYGLDRGEADMVAITRGLAARLAPQSNDEVSTDNAGSAG